MPPPSFGLYRAEEPFEACNENELGFDEGAFIEVVDSTSTRGWWLGRKPGLPRVGLVPSDFLVRVNEA